jgi:hypothetical protein
VYQPMHSHEEEEADDNEQFVYEPSSDAINNESNESNANSEPKLATPPPPTALAPAALSRVEHEKIYAAATSGDLKLLQQLIQTAVADERATVFSLVNEPSPRGGLTLLHSVASRGYLEVVQWRK